MKGNEDNDEGEISAKDHVDGNSDDEISAHMDQELDSDAAKEEKEEEILRTNLELALCTHSVMLSGTSAAAGQEED
jgi:hypothetical protein